MSTPLLFSSSATFTGTDETDSSAYAELFNARAGQQWQITSLTISSDSTDTPQFRVYRNFVSPSTLIDSSASGNNDRSELSNCYMFSTEKLIFYWQYGTVGSSATVVVVGTII